MGCACNGGGTSPRIPDQAQLGSNGVVTEFVLVNPDGSTESFGSRLEADAANARTGFNGVVKAV